MRSPINKRILYIISLCCILIIVLFIGCSRDDSKEEKDNPIHIEPSSLFQGDTARLKPHLNIIGGLVKVSTSEPGKSWLHTKYEIWENGELKTSEAAFSKSIENSNTQEVSVSLTDDINNNNSIEVTTVVSNDSGYGASQFIIPRFDKGLSFGPNELSNAIDIKKGNEIAVWSLLANDKDEYSLSLHNEDIVEDAKKADWAFVLKISIKDDHETENNKADMTVENQEAESAPPDEVIGLASNLQAITADSPGGQSLPPQQVLIDGDVYLLPPGSTADRLLRVSTPQGIAWCLPEKLADDAPPGSYPLEPDTIYLTPARTGGGSLQEESRKLVEVSRQNQLDIAQDMYTFVTGLECTDRWLIYKTKRFLIGGGRAFGPKVYAFDLATGTDRLVVEGQSCCGNFFTLVVGNGCVAWQQTSLQPPDFVDTAGRTYVLNLDTWEQREIANVPSAQRLEIEDDELLVHLINDEIRRYPLIH